MQSVGIFDPDIKRMSLRGGHASDLYIDVSGDVIRWMGYNAFNVYCRELAPGTVSLTGDRAQGDDSKH